MKRIYFAAIICTAIAFTGCKSKGSSDKSADSVSTDNTTASVPEASTADNAPANAPRTYTIKFLPDSAVLGKQKEAEIKLMGVGATDLSDPDGKSQGIELTFKISLTNKNKIGSSSVGVSPSDFRLVLDNNSSISQTSGSYFSAEAESSKESDEITYRLPAGTKPKTLNLFYDETRSSVGLTLE